MKTHPRSWKELEPGDTFVWDDTKRKATQMTAFVVIENGDGQITFAATLPNGAVDLHTHKLKSLDRGYSFRDPTFAWRRLDSDPEPGGRGGLRRGSEYSADGGPVDPPSRVS